MNPKKRVLAVLNREPVDRLPIDIWHTEEIRQLLQSHFGVRDDLDLYRKMNLDKIVWLFPTYQAPDADGPVGSSHFGDAQRSMWGTPLEPTQAGEATYHEFGEPPLCGYETAESLEAFPFWPDPERFDYDAMVATAEAASKDFVVMGPWVSFFEIYCQLRGLETSLTDVAVNPELVNATLDRIEHCQTEMMRRFFDRASSYLELVFISDDMGSQGYGLKVFYHTDGAAEPLIPRLLDCGIDVLNPIQHVCPGMDRAELKRKYGARVIFHGGIENQRVLPFGTPEDVRRETRECLRTLGAGRQGYIACSCHNIQAGTPLDNILAMVETVQTDGAVD